MKTMTIRYIPDEVAGQLKSLAEATNTSVNTTVVQMLSNGVLPKRKQRRVNDLSRFCGGWTQKDLKEFERVMADCERIDPEDWK